MSLVDGLWHRVYVLLRGERYAEEVRREMRFHRELTDIARSGRSLGNETYYREEVRRMTLTSWFDRIRQNATYAIRGFRRAPGFTVAVVLTLGLGIGVNVATFSLFDRVYLHVPNGVSRPDQVHRVYYEYAGREGGRSASAAADYPRFNAIRAEVGASTPMAAYVSPDSILIRDGNRRIAAYSSGVTDGFFSLLGVRAQIGRLFTPSEMDVTTPTPIVVLSDDFWRRAFNGDRGIVGRRVRIRQTEFTIVGVAQPEFTGTDVEVADLWMPISNTTAQGGLMGAPWYQTFGIGLSVLTRTPDAASTTRVASIGTRIVRDIHLTGLEYDSTMRVVTGPLIKAQGPVQQTAALAVTTRVAGVALLVLIIACANVINLFLLRTAGRRREIAVRRALGVSRLRLLEQITVESTILAAVAGIVASAFAIWAGIALRRIVMPTVHWTGSAIDARTVAITAIVSVVLGFLTGIIPAFEAMRPELSNALRSGRGDERHSARLRSSLLALQAALCVILLVGAGLFARSLDNVESIDTGYGTRHHYYVSPTFDDPAAQGDVRAAAFPEVAAQLRGMPGVEAVAYTGIVPLRGSMFGGVYLPGHDSLPHLPGEFGPSEYPVSSDFFKASGLALRTGREFSDADIKGAAGVVIVGESMAKIFWPGQSPIGQCFMTDKRNGECRRVVGVAADAHRMGLIEAPTSQFYVPLAQVDEKPSALILSVRPGSDALVLRSAQEVFRKSLGDMTGFHVRSFDTVIADEVRPWQLGVTLFSALGVLALGVAAIGIYSVVAYGAAQRTHEMGVRVALGARTSDILDLVVGSGIRVVSIGVAIGIGASLLLGRLVASLLFGVVPSDPSVMIGAAALLCAVGTIAGLVPAWRASRVDPVAALRAE